MTNDKKKPDYILIDHTADLGIEIHGKDLKDLFERAAKALIHVMIGDIPPAKTEPVTITVTGDDLADLMVRWLGEVLYLFEGENLVATTIKINYLTSDRVEASLGTVPVDPEIHEISCDIKAVTYHQIEVADKGDCWEARVIFDV